MPHAMPWQTNGVQFWVMTPGQAGPLPGQLAASVPTPAVHEGGRHCEAAGRKTSAGQAGRAPLHVSEMSQVPAAVRHTVPAFPAGCVHTPELHSSRVQSSPSSRHALPSARGMLVQPVIVSQPSVVQSFESSQLTTAPPHTPALHWSGLVQASLSSQADALGKGEQMPCIGPPRLHAWQSFGFELPHAASQHTPSTHSLLRQLSGAPHTVPLGNRGVQVPAWQNSVGRQSAATVHSLQMGPLQPLPLHGTIVGPGQVVLLPVQTSAWMAVSTLQLGARH